MLLSLLPLFLGAEDQTQPSIPRNSVPCIADLRMGLLDRLYSFGEDQVTACSFVIALIESAPVATLDLGSSLPGGGLLYPIFAQFCTSTFVFVLSYSIVMYDGLRVTQDSQGYTEKSCRKNPKTKS